jgi:hypothetical protein
MEKVGAAPGLFPYSFGRVEAPVEDADAPVVPLSVGGRHVCEATLEGMVEAGNFMPSPEVAVEVETAYRLHAGRDSSATSEDAEEEQNRT